MKNLIYLFLLFSTTILFSCSGNGPFGDLPSLMKGYKNKIDKLDKSQEYTNSFEQRAAIERQREKIYEEYKTKIMKASQKITNEPLIIKEDDFFKIVTPLSFSLSHVSWSGSVGLNVNGEVVTTKEILLKEIPFGNLQNLYLIGFNKKGEQIYFCNGIGNLSVTKDGERIYIKANTPIILENISLKPFHADSYESVNSFGITVQYPGFFTMNNLSNTQQLFSNNLK